MSKTIDERVVEMRFDNSRFEKNVQDTIDQLEQLKRSLKFEESSGGLDSFVSKLGNIKSKITSGFKGIFNGVTSVIGSLKNHLSSGSSGIFSGFTNAINNLKNKLSFGRNSGLDNLSAQAGQASAAIDGMGASLDGVKVKFSALQVVGATILSNLTNKALSFVTKGVTGIFSQIKSGGWNRASQLEQARFSMEGILKDTSKVETALDNAAKSVDGTAYALNSAASAASQFAASGVQVGDEMKRALSGVAGVAATTNSDYESIAHIFTTIAGNGKVMTMQLNQLSLRGMNAAASLADYFNKVNKGSVDATASVKKTVKEITKGKQITEGELRELVTKGKVSFEVFSEAMASTFGDQAGKANETFTGAMANIRAALSRTGQMFFTSYGMVDKFGQKFQGIIDQNSEVVKMFNEIRMSVNRFNKALMGQDENGEAIKGLTNVGVAFQQIVLRIAKAIGLFFHYLRGDWFRMLIDGFLNLLKPISQVSEVFRKFMSIVLPANQKGKNIWHYLWWGGYYFKELTSHAKLSVDTLASVSSVLTVLRIIFSKIIGTIKNVYTSFKMAFTYFFNTLGVKGPSLLMILADALRWVSDRLELTSERAGYLSSIIWALMSVLRLIIIVIKGLFTAFAPLLQLFGIFVDTTADGMLGAAGSIAEFTEALAEAAANTTVFDKIREKVISFVEFVEKPFNAIRDFINKVFGWFRELGYQIGEFYKDGTGRSFWSAIMEGWKAVEGDNPFIKMIGWLKELKKNVDEATGWNWTPFKEAFDFGKNRSFWGSDKQGGGILGGIIDSISEGAWRITTIFAGVYKTITGKDIYDNIQGFWETTMVDIEIAVYKGVRNIQTAFRTMFKGAKSSYLSGGEGFGGIASMMFDGFIGALRGISTLIKKYTGKDITGFVNKTLVPAIQNAKKIVIGFIDSLTAKYPKLKAINDGIKDFAHKVVDWVRALKGSKDGWKSVTPSKSIQPFIQGSEKMQKVAGYLDKVYSAIKRFGAKAVPVLRISLDKMAIAFKKMISYIREKDLVSKFKTAFEKIYKAIVNGAKRVKTAYDTVSKAVKTGWQGFKNVSEPVISFIKKFATRLKEVFLVLKTNISNALSNADFSKPLDIIKAFFKGLQDTIPEIIEAIKDFGRKIIDGFKELFGGKDNDLDDSQNELQEFSDGMTPVAETLKKAGGTLGDAFDTVNAAFRKVGKNANMADILSKFASGFRAFVDFMKPIAGFISTVLKKIGPIIGDFFDALSSAFEKGSIDDVASLVKGGALFIIADALHRYINSIIKIGNKSKASKSVFDSIIGAFDQIKIFFRDKVGKWLRVGTLISFAFALSVLANAVLILGSMNAGDALQGTVIVLLLMRQLKKIMKMADKMADNEDDILRFGKVATRLSIALWVLTKSVRTIGDMNAGKAVLGIAASLILLEAMVGFIEELHLVAHSISTTDMAGVDTLVSLISTMSLVAVVLAIAVRMIGKMDPGKAVQGLVGVLLVIGAMVGVMYALDTFVKDGEKAQVGAESLLMVAAGLLIAAYSIKVLSDMGWEGMARGLIGMTVALGIMVGALALLALLSFEGFGALIAAGAIVAVSVAMLIFASATHVLASGLTKLTPALKKFGEDIDWGTIFKSLVFFLDMAIVGAVVAGTLIVLAGACVIFAAALAPLGIALFEVATAFWIFTSGMYIIAAAVSLIFNTLIGSIKAMISSLNKVGEIENFGEKLSKFADMVGVFAISAVKIGLAATVLGIGLAVLGVGFGVFAIAAVIFGVAANIIAVAAVKLAGGISLLAIGLKKFGDALVYLNNLEGVTDGLGKFSKILGALAKTAGVMVLLGIGAAVLGAGLVVLGVGLAFTVGSVALLANAIAKLVAVLGILAMLAPEAFGNLRNVLSIAIDAVGKLIADLVLSIPKLISGVLKGLAESAGEILASLESTLAQFLAPMAEMAMDIIDALLDAFDQHAESFAEKGASAATKFMEGLGRKADGLVKAAYDMCMNFLNAFDKYVPQFTEKGFDVIIGMVDGISEAIDKKAPELRAAIERLKESFHNGLDLIIHGTKEKGKEAGSKAPEGVKEGVEEGADFDGATGGLKDMLMTSISTAFFGADAEAKTAEGGKSGKGILDGIKEWATAEKFQGTCDAVMGAVIQGFKNSAATYLESSLGPVGKLVGKHLRKGIESDTGETGKSTKKHVDSAKQSVEQGKKSLETAASGYKGAIASGVNKGSGNIKGAVDSVVKPAKTQADNYKNNFQNVGRHWMEYCSKAVKAAGNANVIPGVKAVAQKAKTIANDYQNNFINVGKHWMNGLAKGIAANGKKAIDAAKAIADKVSKITAKALQEKSPSRLSFKYGKFWTEGLANGIISLADSIAKVSQIVAEKAITPLVDGIGSAVDQVTNSDANFQPVVSPVMDMTNVRQGAYDISNMLYAAQSAGLANGMSNEFNANSYEQMNSELRVDNRDLLRSINSLSGEVGDLKEVVRNLRVYMDTGALVGEIRDPIDKALGVKAAHKARGG